MIADLHAHANSVVVKANMGADEEDKLPEEELMAQITLVTHYIPHSVLSVLTIRTAPLCSPPRTRRRTR